MSTKPISARRILIGAASFADAKAAFQLVEGLTKELATELGGLLVEETILTEIVDLPKQRVITSTGSMIVAPSRKQIKKLAEWDAKAFRETLSKLADDRRWSFERRRGELVSGLCEVAKGRDLLLFGYRPAHGLTGRVVLVAPDMESAPDAVHLASELARALGAGSVALTMNPAGLETAAIELKQERFDSEQALLERIARSHASVVVMDMTVGPLRSFDQLRQLLASARCPVVVLGAGQGEPPLEPAPQTTSGPRDRA